MPWPRKRDHRRVSRALLAGATIVAALGVLSTRLVVGVLVGGQHAVLFVTGLVGWYSANSGPVASDFTERWGPFVLDRNDHPMAWWVLSLPAEGFVGIPMWMPFAALLVPGAWLAIQHRRRSGHCPKCDYDLVGLEPGAPCPECGRPIDRPGEAPTP